MKFKVNFQPNKEHWTEEVSHPPKHKLEVVKPQAKPIVHMDLPQTKCVVLSWLSFEPDQGLTQADHKLNWDFTPG